MNEKKPGRCVRCGADAVFKFDEKYICDECYSIACSCCIGELEAGFDKSEKCEVDKK
jgi:hypothetical protein